LASEISTNVKMCLWFRNHEKQRKYSVGEVHSCLSMLVSIAKDHNSPDGVGYLKWVKTFFAGKMPTNIVDILDYLFQNEV
jgi:hypothetical protein